MEHMKRWYEMELNSIIIRPRLKSAIEALFYASIFFVVMAFVAVIVTALPSFSGVPLTFALKGNVVASMVFAFMAYTALMREKAVHAQQVLSQLGSYYKKEAGELCACLYKDVIEEEDQYLAAVEAAVMEINNA